MLRPLLARLFTALVALVLGLSAPPLSARSLPASADPGDNPRQFQGRELPPEALATLALIQRGGPFPFRQDGVTFQNRERRLPGRPRGYYREYTVVTPGATDRGARRIIAGGDPPREFYYTADHYRSFRPVERYP